VSASRRTIWISYCPLGEARRDIRALCRLSGHRQLIAAERPWEARSIGAGTPPIRTPSSWLLLYHGSRNIELPSDEERKPVVYCAGLLLLDADDPRMMRYRAATPIMEPQRAEEWDGPIAGGVFPTGIDEAGAGKFEIYYGMADTLVGAARLWMPAV
jgi:beta-1,2-mannobiose phosphorylase / 1,2-beta-oligomannan phosphorylase